MKIMKLLICVVLPTILGSCVAGIIQEGTEETVRIQQARIAKMARESSQRNQEILKQQQSIPQTQDQGNSLDENIKMLQRLQTIQQQHGVSP